MSHTPPTPPLVFGSRDAAEYLSLSLSTIKHHVYNTGKLVPDQKIGNRLVFYEQTLIKFAESERKIGRPTRDPVPCRHCGLLLIRENRKWVHEEKLDLHHKAQPRVESEGENGNE